MLPGALGKKFFLLGNTDDRKTKEDRLPAYHNHDKRVTVKRGIFPNMIRTKVIKRKLFNQEYNSSTMSNHSDETDQPKLLNFDRIDRMISSRTPVNVRKRSTITDEDRKVETIMSDSPYLLYANQPEFFHDDKEREGPRPTYVKTPKNAVKKKRSDFMTPSGVSYEADDDTMRKDEDSSQKFPENEEEAKKREHEKIKFKVTQIESCFPHEAEQMFYYQQFTESIKRLMIVERELNFEPFPDTFETIKSKLHALKTLRRNQTLSHNHDDNFVPEDFRPVKVTPRKEEDFFPMDIDEDPLFCTPRPILQENAVATMNEPSSSKSLNLIFDKEDDMPPPFEFKTNEKRISFDFKPTKVVRKELDIEFLPSIVIGEVRNPGVEEAKKTDWFSIDSEFNTNQKRHTEFSSDKPSFAIGDTIDQNAGLDGIEYLKNVCENGPKNSHNREIGKKNELDGNWWDTRVNDYRDDRRVIDVDSDVFKWRSAYQFHVPETIISSDVQFALPCAFSQQNDDHEFFPSKQFTNFGKNAHREESIYFNTETARSSEIGPKYFKYRIDDDDDESPLFGSPRSVFRR